MKERRDLEKFSRWGEGLSYKSDFVDCGFPQPQQLRPGEHAAAGDSRAPTEACRSNRNGDFV